MSNPYQPPPLGSEHTPPPLPGGPQQGDSTGGLIPYKNPHALTAYYLGIVSLLCCLSGLPLGLVPVVLGIMGLRNRARNPIIKGSIHAWIGIVLGAISTLGSVLVAIAIIGSLLAKR